MYAVRNEVIRQFDTDAELTGKEWAQYFMKLHGLCLWQPQKTSIARSMGFNRVQLNNYLDNLESLMRTHTFSPIRVYNMDETGIQMVPGKLCRIAVTFAKENNINLLSLPPHSSQKTQHLDRYFFKLLKVKYDELCDQWSGNHAGVSVSQYEIADIFGQAFMRVATLDIAVNAFCTCGIVPFNRYIFTDEDFLSSEATDQNCGITFDEIDTEDMSVIHFSSGTVVDYSAQVPSDTIPLQFDVPSTSAHPAISIVDSSSVYSPTNSSAPNNIPVLLEPSIAITPKESATDPSTSKHPAPVHIISKTLADSSYRSTVAANTEFSGKKETWTEISSSNGNSSQDILGRTKKEARTGREKQTIRISLFQSKRKTSSRTTMTNQNTDTPSKPTGSKGKEVSPSCDDVFVKPPLEEWIQCGGIVA
ncbi:hypothetical protein PR048_021365 [Dryococelus australis]|uniref:DDE-1 domain-containing protein n=1 Tax=Dryococelus australis TaxID=614101 RepID=A0ABQ9GY01_9NEOP|nr:hypothetical protein PR048_021365 [Dryococelus australis]